MRKYTTNYTPRTTDHYLFFSFFFFHVPATTEIYTLSLHDALPICVQPLQTDFPEQAAGRSGTEQVEYSADRADGHGQDAAGANPFADAGRDRKSTRLNSSHPSISYAVFCLKKKKKK